MKSDFLLLQINDALFPIGAYAHSYGLETYIQKGLVSNADEASAFLRQMLCSSLKTMDLLAVKLAWEYGKAEDFEQLKQLDRNLDVLKVPGEIRAASQKLGSRFVKTIRSMAKEGEFTSFFCYAELTGVQKIHHSTAYGVFCHSAGICREEAVKRFLYAQISAMITNCVKSIPLSQSQGQEMLYNLYPVMEEVLKENECMEKDALGRSAPGIDLRAMQHERLYSRIYMS